MPKLRRSTKGKDIQLVTVQAVRCECGCDEIYVKDILFDGQLAPKAVGVDLDLRDGYHSDKRGVYPYVPFDKDRYTQPDDSAYEVDNETA